MFRIIIASNSKAFNDLSHIRRKMKYMLDTNVMVNDPGSIYAFDEHEVLIPLLSIQELDDLKKRNDNAGSSARQAARNLDSLRTSGNLHNGVVCNKKGGTIRVVRTPNELTFNVFGTPKNDHMILQSCLNEGAILVTEDINLRILADAICVPVERYENARIDSSQMYDNNYIGITLSDDKVKDLFSNGKLTLSIQDWLESSDVNPDDIKDNSQVIGNGFLAVSEDSGKKIHLVNDNIRAMNLKPKNKEQSFALDALFEPSIDLVVLAGPAGSGKTLCAVAAGLEQTTERGLYSSVAITRPVVPLGNDIGYLPGSLDEKLDPWMGPIWDAIDVLVPAKKGLPMSPSDFYRENGYMKMMAITYIRGRSLPGHFLIIDEAQNLTQHEAKTIITRAGKGTKVVLTGDPFQIDSPYLNQDNNGMSYVIDKFNGQPNFSYVYMKKGVRSRLAEMAATLM